MFVRVDGWGYNLCKEMEKGKARFSWAIFGASATVFLTTGSIIVSNVDVSLTELIKSVAILIPSSLLLSIILGYWKPIWNASSKRIWMHFAKVISKRYLEKKINELRSKILILGLKNNSGTVNLILEAGVNNGISPKMMLDIVTEPGGERYGEVEVTQLSNDACIASPTNRINIEFWEKLEDRMKSDPSPPPNVVAKRQVSDRLIESLKLLHKKEGKHGY